MALSDKSISIARSWLGYKEGANNDTIFGKEFGMNFVAWCVQFVTDVYDASGLEAGKDYPYTASSGAAVNWYKEHNSFNLSGGGYEPRSGDSVFFWDGSKVYHTGIVESVKDGIVSTIEGNAGPGSDSVVSNSYKLSDPKIYGFGTPKFTGVSTTNDKDAKIAGIVSLFAPAGRNTTTAPTIGGWISGNNTFGEALTGKYKDPESIPFLAKAGLILGGAIFILIAITLMFGEDIATVATMVAAPEAAPAVAASKASQKGSN